VEILLTVARVLITSGSLEELWRLNTLIDLSAAVNSVVRVAAMATGTSEKYACVILSSSCILDGRYWGVLCRWCTAMPCAVVY
jgi:hypothetical protein